MKKRTTKKTNDFKSFIEKNLSKENFDKLPELFKASKKMVTMRLKNPKRLTGAQLNTLIRLTGLNFEDFKAFII